MTKTMTDGTFPLTRLVQNFTLFIEVINWQPNPVCNYV